MMRTHQQIDALVASIPPGNHGQLPTVLRMVAAGVAPLLVGPAGCGKSSMARVVASCMNLRFGYARAVRDEYALLGYRDAHGTYVGTTFRTCFENGGVFLLDEIDAGNPQALLALNDALANGECDFPDGMVTAHADFHVLAAANTYGTGRDRQYVGRTQLDATTLDRFEVLDVTYDETLERSLNAPLHWILKVLDAREAVAKTGVRHIISTRAIVAGARQLAAGLDLAHVERSSLWRGLPDDQVQRVRANMRDRSFSHAPAPWPLRHAPRLCATCGVDMHNAVGWNAPSENDDDTCEGCADAAEWRHSQTLLKQRCDCEEALRRQLQRRLEQLEADRDWCEVRDDDAVPDVSNIPEPRIIEPSPAPRSVTVTTTGRQQNALDQLLGLKKSPKERYRRR